MLPWSIKYLPKSTSDIQGQNLAVSKLLEFVKSFPKAKAALIYGPPGCGKTCTAYAIANELDLEIIEVNASDVRDAESIRSKLGNAASQMSLFSKGKLILVDEIDGVSGSEDRGGLSELASLLDKTHFPIVMTANDPWDQKFTTLRKKSEMIEFHSLMYTSLLAVLKKIAGAEAIDFEDTALTALARRAGGDLRGAINDFETLSEFSKKLMQKDVDELSGRKQKETMINALMRIFKTTDPSVALSALDDVDEEIDDVFLWLDENLPKEYTLVEDIANAYDNMSMADVFRGRIRRWQHWRFLIYISNLLTAGIALSKKEKYHGFNKYTRTTRILNIWQSNQKNAKKKAISQKIAEKTHTSLKRARSDTFPYMKALFKNNKEKSDKVAVFLDLDKEEIAYMRA